MFVAGVAWESGMFLVLSLVNINYTIYKVMDVLNVWIGRMVLLSA